MNTDYGDPLCNLCWEVIKEPYIVTSCNHAFCMKHESDPRIQQSTCPGCGSHLPSKNGLLVARFRVSKEDTRSLCGLQPDVVIELATNALDFWSDQERTRSDFFAHKWSEAKKVKDEQKQSFKSAHENLAQELLVERQRVQQADARGDELKQELQLLEDKYTEETRKVRMLQERMIEWKRKRSESPQHPSALASPEHGAAGSSRHRCDGSSGFCNPACNPRTSPMRSHSVPPRALGGGGLGGGMGGGMGGGFGSGGLSRHASPAQHHTSSGPPAPLGRSMPSLGGGGFGLGAASGSVSRFGSLAHLTTPTTSSRQSTPVHRSIGSIGGSALSYGGRR